MTASLQQWALPRLKQLLPLDDQSLGEIITYTDTLPKDQAANHLSNILGDEPKALEFISAFNLRRQNAPAEAAPAHPVSATQPRNHDRQRAVSPAGASGSGVDGLPRPSARKKKPPASIHALPARQIQGHGIVEGAYRKQEDPDYIPARSRQQEQHRVQVADNLALHDRPPDVLQLPLITDSVGSTTKAIQSKLPPSATGQLTSDLPTPKRTSAQCSRHSSPAPKTKVSVTGGTAMHGQSTTLSDLDAAIRSLEIQTNPTISAGSAADNKARQCNCMATRHPLLDIAPNCLNCGKVVCVKQGLGPCTFCGMPLLSSEDISKVLRVLKDERGDERMRANNQAQKKADVSHGRAKAFTGREFLAAQRNSGSTRTSPLSSAPASDTEPEDSAQKAKAHRDKLLNFQANNAKRTTIKDEAGDYDIPASGTSMWASPAERAHQLKRQQKVLREMEWAAKPEYEKRRVVASIDVAKGKVVRRMAEVEKPDFEAQDSAADEDAEEDFAMAHSVEAGGGKGAFSHNPLLQGGMIRPQARVEKGKGREVGEEKQTWRRVQMDEDDNEAWILDGGVYGSRPQGTDGRVLGKEEHAFG